MKSGYFIKVMSIFGIVSGIVFVLLLLFTNPAQGVGTKSLFLFTLFVFIFSIYSLLTFILKRKASNNEVSFSAIKSSLRQGILLGTFVITSLLLAVIGLLTWWDVLLLAFALILIELYFNSNKAGEIQQ